MDESSAKDTVEQYANKKHTNQWKSLKAVYALALITALAANLFMVLKIIPVPTPLGIFLNIITIAGSIAYLFFSQKASVRKKRVLTDLLQISWSTAP